MLLYTALGDSITAGSGATSPACAYPALLVAMLRKRGVPVVGEVLAQPGWTSAALDAAVFANSPETLARAKAITVFIGGDNLAYAGLALARGAKPTVLAGAVRSYAADITWLVKSIKHVSKARIILCTQYNPFPNSQLAARGVSTLNGTTAAVAARLHTSIAPVHAWFAGNTQNLIAGYRTGRLEDLLKSPALPIHPNDVGHQVIARGLLPYIGA